MPQTIIFNTGSILFTTSSNFPPSSSASTGSTSGHQIWSGSNPANNITMSGATSSVSFFTSSFVSVSVQQSLQSYGNATTTGSFEIIGIVTESNGQSTHSRFHRHIDFEGSSSVGPMTQTASISLGFNNAGEWSISKPQESNPDLKFPQPERIFIYVSRSGRIGFKTTDPKDDIDFKANSIKFRSDDGTKELEFTDGKFTTKKFKGIAVGGEEVAETSGSEIVLSYTPGTFEAPSTASAGDVLGTITWEDLSIGNRDDATAMRIRGVVNAVAADAAAIKASMNFGIGSSIPGSPIVDYAVLGEGSFQITNSAAFGIDNGSIIIGNTRANPGDADRKIIFYNNSTANRWVMGSDVSQNKFAIHSSISFVGNNEFELDSSGNVVIQGDLYADQLRATGGYPNFTGSTIGIDGGSF